MRATIGLVFLVFNVEWSETRACSKNKSLVYPEVTLMNKFNDIEHYHTSLLIDEKSSLSINPRCVQNNVKLGRLRYDKIFFSAKGFGKLNIPRN